MLPDVSGLSLNGHLPAAEDKRTTDNDEECLRKLKAYTNTLPYSVEPRSKMMEMLNFILLRITQCMEARDYDVGLLQWDSMLT